MGILEDTLKALERIPAWKRLNALPSELAELRARVDALERRLAGGGEICPKCKNPAFMLEKTEPAPPPWGRMGEKIDSLRCSSCGHSDVRRHM